MLLTDLLHGNTHMHQELLNRLLSGKKLTGLDKREIRSLWWEKMDAMQESATRQHEQDTLRTFIGEDGQ
ncbi:hypothetical protein E6A75_15150 [Escherichia coli]|nr:hypothetical protein [Escherichia coli]